MRTSNKLVMYAEKWKDKTGTYCFAAPITTEEKEDLLKEFVDGLLYKSHTDTELMIFKGMDLYIHPQAEKIRDI